MNSHYYKRNYKRNCNCSCNCNVEKNITQERHILEYQVRMLKRLSKVMDEAKNTKDLCNKINELYEEIKIDAFTSKLLHL